MIILNYSKSSIDKCLTETSQIRLQLHTHSNYRINELRKFSIEKKVECIRCFTPDFIKRETYLQELMLKMDGQSLQDIYVFCTFVACSIQEIRGIIYSSTKKIHFLKTGRP